MNSDYIRDKDKEHYIEDFTGTYREIKKWYREIIYNKKKSQSNLSSLWKF